MQKIVAADTARTLELTLTNDGKVPTDLTGVTSVVLHYSVGLVAKQATMTIATPATSGVVTYMFGATDIPSSGQLSGRVVITFSDNTVLTSPDPFFIPVTGAA